MKAATIIRLAIGLCIISFVISILAISLQQVQAQDSGDYTEPPEKYSREELTQMLAPIALYPDALLSQVLMAATYPIEVIEADRWVRKNPDLKDEALDEALLEKNWDPSVKAVCHFPSILALMSEKIVETTNLGNAFLAQEDEVMDIVQDLRAKAYARGNLSTSSEQKVIVEKETIIIEPADPRVVYVPYYDPVYVYGPWWYPAYPPYYWGPPGVSIGIGISYWPGFYFGFAYGGWSYFDWHRHYVYIDVYKRPRYVRHDHWHAKPGRWTHAPVHRRGVAYRDKPTAEKYGQYPYRTRDYRRDTRGYPESRDRDTRGSDRAKIDRDRHEQRRVESERQVQQRTSQSSQKRQRIEPDRQKQQRVESSRQVQQRTSQDSRERQRIEPDSQKQQRVESSRQVQQRTSQSSQERQRIEPDRQKQQRVETSRQVQQQRTYQERQAQQQVERVQQQRSRDNVFNRVDDSRREYQSSARGRDSRQGSGYDSRGGDRSSGNNRGGSGNRNGSGNRGRNSR